MWWTLLLTAISGASQAESDQQAAASKQNYYNFLASQNIAQAALVESRGEETATGIAETSAIDENNLDRESRRVVGSQTAAEGASGTSGSVTAEDIARDSSRTHDMDVSALRYDADSKIWATRTAAADQATALRNQAAQFQFAGANAKEAGDLNATSSLLGTATSVADTWYRYGQAGGGRTAPNVRTTSAPRGGYTAAPDYGNA